jgi:xanthine dehydrogenase accessory factor
VRDVPLAAVRGGGDLGTACALRLIRAGLRLIVAEQPPPTTVRRTVAFSEAVVEGRIEVEGVVAVRVDSASDIRTALLNGQVPVLVDPGLTQVLPLLPDLILDATVAKAGTGMTREMAPGTIALGPGFVAGADVDAVIETNRGPDLGRVIWNGPAEANTHVPAAVAGHAQDRVLRSPIAGVFQAWNTIGDIVDEDAVVGDVDGEVVRAPFPGLVRGLLRSGIEVRKGMKVGDLDPRLDVSLCYRVSDKALAVAGGALEASMMLLSRQGWSLRHAGT